MFSDYLKGQEPRQRLEKRMRAEGRLPPGQSASIKWPVLHVGDDPVFDAATWDFKAGGLVEATSTVSFTSADVPPFETRVQRRADRGSGSPEATPSAKRSRRSLHLIFDGRPEAGRAKTAEAPSAVAVLMKSRRETLGFMFRIQPRPPCAH